MEPVSTKICVSHKCDAPVKRFGLCDACEATTKHRDLAPRDAETIKDNGNGFLLVLAKDESDVWPGWRAPLDTAGYWVGISSRHWQIDATSEAEAIKEFGYWTN